MKRMVLLIAVLMQGCAEGDGTYGATDETGGGAPVETGGSLVAAATGGEVATGGSAATGGNTATGGANGTGGAAANGSQAAVSTCKTGSLGCSCFYDGATCPYKTDPAVPLGCCQGVCLPISSCL